MDRAREEAENLFKPRPRPPTAEASGAASNNVVDEQQTKRPPRIFLVPPVVPMGQAKPVNATEPEPIQRRRAVKRETRHVPPSQFGRIRALANYGMTQTEVAELYGVSVGEIERIVGRPEA
jgi:DNA-directed RNA polymerase specialized sigma24 family protein